ncbi:methylmalonyl Co-A mutase-associated GTPase MeaB [Nitratireductor soli]|uniref:methylmalonyl Co-A mutase-associated GTPase MeaB n=1 Tax=Nitratireductor soli TaxID=1670619 RepID=UPI00065DDAFA|nr:methylmalonyl Co-A mutase-associated GTPase MeaB [Nitratireductor soli]
MDGSARRRIARAISAVENRSGAYEATLRDAYRSPQWARIIGVTGPPGVGKSTFVDRFSLHLAEAGHRVAVLAIDPSSPYSGGALLGDRVRQGDSAAHDAIFFRSVSARGHIGGLSETAVDVIATLSSFGFGYVLLETVGAGQSDVEIQEIADCTLVMTVPGLGDGVQASKAGLMEIGDLFIVNKSDQSGAKDTARLIRSVIAAAYMGEPGLNRVERQQLHGEHRMPASAGSLALMRRHGDMVNEETIWVPPVLQVSANAGQGIDAVAGMAQSFLDWFAATGRREARHRDRLYRQILRALSALFLAPYRVPPTTADYPAAVGAWVDRVSAGEASPFDAARALAACAGSAAGRRPDAAKNNKGG